VTDRAIVVAGLRVRLERALIVDGIDLEVGAGEWVTIIGPNGAGKSTALRAIGGLLPFEGGVELNGVPVDKLHRRDRAKTIATDLATVDDVLGELDLGRFAGRRLDTLSGGERQRVFLARALAQGARILLLDEPTSALDIGHQQEVLELVDRLRTERGLTVLATMHDLTTAGEYAERMVLIANGRVVAAGSPRAVLTEENLAEHYRVKARVIEGEHGPLVVPVRG
jgi:iron complex transport system ATP-binding protein